MSRWRDVTDRLKDGHHARSSKWRGVRDDFLQGQVCAVCERRNYLVAHHIVPFSLAPEFELEPDNLMALCEGGKYGIKSCHQLFGHLGNWRRFNPHIRATVIFWNALLKDKL